jgi:hypothetical protein
MMLRTRSVDANTLALLQDIGKKNCRNCSYKGTMALQKYTNYNML